MGDRDTRDTIPFKMFFFRKVTLFCLLSGQWDQAFPTIDIRLMDVSDDRVISYIREDLKMTRPRFHQSPLDWREFFQIVKQFVLLNA